MATPLTDKINALTSAANETTGASDTTLGDAVATLIAGYGGGSSNIETGTITVSSDSRYLTISHSLGTIPKLCYFMCDDLSVPDAETFVGGLGAYVGSDYNCYVTSSAYKTGIFDTTIYLTTTEYKLYRQNITSTAYGFETSNWTSTSVRCVTSSSSKYWRQGTYTYIIVA